MTIDNNRWQLKNTNFLAIDWSSISDINRLIVIDCHRLSSIVVDYRFNRLVRPGYFVGSRTSCWGPKTKPGIETILAAILDLTKN